MVKVSQFPFENHNKLVKCVNVLGISKCSIEYWIRQGFRPVEQSDFDVVLRITNFHFASRGERREDHFVHLDEIVFWFHIQSKTLRYVSLTLLWKEHARQNSASSTVAHFVQWWMTYLRLVSSKNLMNAPYGHGGRSRPNIPCSQIFPEQGQGLL